MMPSNNLALINSPIFTDRETDDLLDVMPVYPIFGKITGSLAGGVILSYLLKCSFINGHSEFSKTNQEIMDNCIINRDSFNTAIKKIDRLQVFKRFAKGLPRKTYYKIDLSMFCKILMEYKKCAT